MRYARIPAAPSLQSRGLAQNLIRHDRRAIGDGVINPLCFIEWQAHATVRDVLSKTPVLHIKGPLVVLDRVDKIVAKELRIVVAGVPTSEGIALACDGELAPNRRCRRGTRGTNEFLDRCPGALTTLIYAKATAICVNENEPTSSARILLCTVLHVRVTEDRLAYPSTAGVEHLIFSVDIMRPRYHGS